VICFVFRTAALDILDANYTLGLFNMDAFLFIWGASNVCY